MTLLQYVWGDSKLCPCIQRKFEGLFAPGTQPPTDVYLFDYIAAVKVSYGRDLHVKHDAPVPGCPLCVLWPTWDDSIVLQEPLFEVRMRPRVCLGIKVFKIVCNNVYEYRVAVVQPFSPVSYHDIEVSRDVVLILCGQTVIQIFVKFTGYFRIGIVFGPIFYRFCL